MMVLPVEVMSLVRQCSDVAGTNETLQEASPMPLLVPDNAKSHRNSVTEMTQITSPPPLRPYVKTIGSAKRKRIVQQKSIDRWNATTTTNSSDCGPFQYQQTPMSQKKSLSNHRTPRDSILLSPMQFLRGGSDNMDREMKYHFSPIALSSPTTSTLHSMLIYNMIYGGSSNRSMNETKDDVGVTNPDPRNNVSMTDSPPSVDSSPRVVRRLPSDAGGLDDIHRMMMISPEKTHEENSPNFSLKRNVALPRRPERRSSRRGAAMLETANDTQSMRMHSDSNDDVPMVMIPRKVNSVDLSPRKPARRVVSRYGAMQPAPVSPHHADIGPTPLSSIAHSCSPHHHHHHHRSPITNRNTVNSSNHHHNNNNNRRTVKYLVEALTIVNLCDIENDATSSLHNKPSKIICTDGKESIGRRCHRLERTPLDEMNTGYQSSSDESTVESIPSRDSRNEPDDTREKHPARLPKAA